MDANHLIIAGLAMIMAGGVFYALIYPHLSGDIKAEKRQAALGAPIGAKRASSDRVTDAAARRKQIAESLKELESRSKGKRLSLETKIAQAGLGLGRRQFLLASAGGALVVGALVYYMTGNPMTAAAGLGIGGLGLPHWLLAFRKKRRVNKFVNEFPNAVDIIVRGTKAGLPLGDCLRIIASEAVEPVKSEFRHIIEAQAMGLSISESVERIVERVPVAESNFFSIVITIQQKAGGNLSEALGNLSRVLRDRKKMKQKISAMSSEAKASAGIIGALPPVVTGMVYLTSPQYIELLWSTTTGRLALAACGFWMFLGIMTMRKMINFDM